MFFLRCLTFVFTMGPLWRMQTAATQIESHPAVPANPIDPHSLLVLRANANNEETEFKETMAWIDNLSSAPACTQFATSNLLTDCQVHDNPSGFVESHPGQNIENVQNEYALKLALCEYAGVHHNPTARLKAPPRCHAFLPSTEACGKRSWLWGRTEVSNDELCYPKATKSDLNECLMTMQSSAQTWISYSNARSRAMQVCHLSRRHIEREQDLQLYKNFTFVASRLRDSVHVSESKLQLMVSQMQHHLDESRRSFEALQQATDDMSRSTAHAQKQHQNDLAQTQERFRNVQSEMEIFQQRNSMQLNSLAATFDTRMEIVLNKAIDAIGEATASVITKMATEISTYHQKSMEEHSGQIERANADLQDTHKRNILALELQHKATMESFVIMQQALDSQIHKIDVASEKQDSLDSKQDNSLSKADMLSEKQDHLVSKQDDSLTKADSLVTVLGTIGSLAQGIELVFEALSSVFYNVKGILVAFAVFICCCTAYFVGNMFRKLPLRALGTLSGITLIGYSLPRSLPALTHAMPWTLVGTLAQTDVTEHALLWAQATAFVLVIIFVVSIIVRFMSSPAGMFRDLLGHLELFRWRIHSTLTRNRDGSADALPSFEIDEELQYRMQNFKRASTVC